MSLFAFDDSIRSQGYLTIAGIDEVGRGCIAGPLVAACVSFKGDVFIEGIRDSKELFPKEREELFQKIIDNAFVGIGIVDVDLIDRLNIVEATRLAMKKAYESLGRDIQLLLIDAIQIPELKINQKVIVKGDKKSAVIASASIVAKVTRDRIMRQYHKVYPQYGFEKNKGYATKEHLMALKKFGPCPIHRKSFSPVKELTLF
ncbi:MAG: ribonuclease HII [Thermodesulfovibrio sp.]|nr:ribonuclease HII [Thermodesulfovibrio sp.]